MALCKREKYYNRCQEIVDDLHRRVAGGEFLSDKRCCDLYGTSDYNALAHELRLQSADAGIEAMTSAMEWLYQTRYFVNKYSEEKRQKRMFWITVILAISAIISMVVAVLSVLN